MRMEIPSCPWALFGPKDCPHLVLENTEGQNSFCSFENQIIREIPAIFNSSSLLSKEFIKSIWIHEIRSNNTQILLLKGVYK